MLKISEAVARALRAETYAPGSDPKKIEWPTKNNSANSRYRTLGAAVERMLIEEGYVFPDYADPPVKFHR